MDGDVRGSVTAVSRNGVYSFSKPNRDEIVLVAGLGVEGDVHAGPTVRHRSRVRADPGQPNLRQVHLIHDELFDELRADGWQVESGQMGENLTTRGVDLLGLPRGTILRFGPPADAAEGALAGSGTRGDGEGAGGEGAGARGDGESARDRAAGVSVAPPDAGGAVDAVAGVMAAAERSELESHVAGAVAAFTAAVARFGASEPDEQPDGRAVVVITGLRNPCQQINTNLGDGLLKEVAYRDADGRFVRKAGVMGVVLRGGPIRPGDPVAVELPPLPHEPLDRV